VDLRASGRLVLGAVASASCYGGYHVIALGKEEYGYAMVTGPSRSYLWILSRQSQLADDTLLSLVVQAHEWGFDTEGSVYVEHDIEME
jgi:apolipoprotein D and lipocalin family protein